MTGDDSQEKSVGDPEAEGELPPKSETLSASIFKRLNTPIQFGKRKTPQPEQPESDLDPQWRESFERVRQCKDPVSRELAMRTEIKNFPEFKLSEYRKLYELWDNWDKKPSAVDQIFPARKWIINTPFWKWTGIGEKKGWDILQLLIAPVLIASIGFGLQRYFTKKDAEQLKAEQQKNQLIAESKAKQDRQLADEKAKQETLVRYLDQMAISIDRNLLKAKPGDKEFIIAQARTVIALQSLDNKRQNLVIQYLQAAGLNQASFIRIDKAGFAQLGEGVISLLYQAQMEKANLKESDLSGAVLIRAKLASADLSKANLSSAVLTNADLSRANLSRANLSRANLAIADLYSAILSRANLSRANLSSADLSGADLNGADLNGADLKDAKLGAADFLGANLFGANLSNANFFDANLSSADLYSANLFGAKLGDAKLYNADLSYADLSYADLSYANLESAILIRANLSSANFSSADLHNAIFFGVDLSQTKNLTQQQLEEENPPLLCNVKLPKGINVDPNRHCKKLPQVLLERYPKRFKTLKDAQDYVNKFSKP